MTQIRLKEKYRIHKIVKKAPKSGSGHTGNGTRPARYLKKHERANGLPGTAQGVCLGQKEVRDRKGRLLDTCQCGKHHG